MQARFARRLPARIEALLALVDEARDAAGADSARREAHKLAGTAGSYGYAEVGRAARRLEHALEHAPAHAVGSGPDVRAAADALRAATPAATIARPPATSRNGTPRILLVDADAGARERCQRLAGRALAELVATGSLDTALRLAADRAWDALIVDASVGPANDPFGPARTLRRAAAEHVIPLAVTSADDSLAVRVAAAHAGADQFVCKPVSSTTLSEAIAALVAQARASRPRVLALDDDIDFLARIAEVLRDDGVETRTLADPRRLVHELRAADPHALLLDFDMPDYNGAELCATLRADREFHDLPIVIVTGRGDPETRLSAFEAGADDYVLKPIVPVELCARVRARIERSVLLRAQAERDTLTGLPLRRVFVAALEARLSEANRRDTPLSVCLIDLDGFKQVNDLHGHLAGDHALSELGRLLADRFRVEDLRCRWGGEEFALAFPGEPADRIHPVMERVIEELAAIQLVGEHGRPFSVTFSGGIAERPADGTTLEALLRAADRRLYAAKDAGRRRIVSARTRA